MRWTGAFTIGLLMLSGWNPAPAETQPPGERPQELSAIVEANNLFAFDLYAQLRDEPGNLFFSPYSISSALAMTYAGARGETAAEMAAALHFPDDHRALHPAFGGLNRRLFDPEVERDYEIHLANALWGQRGYPFLAEFIDLLVRHYEAALYETDFASDPEAARQRINAWVEQQTRDRIRDLIPPDLLDVDTRLVLTNAIYFKSDWANEFDPAETRDADFHLSAGQTAEVPMMRQKAHFQYHQDETVQVLQMPYVGEELAMAVVLPRRRGALKEIEATLSPLWLSERLDQLQHREVEVYLPRFSMTSDFELKDALSALGMPRAFVFAVADFTGIAPDPRLHIYDVVHKAFVEVNEEGTEAAAATGVVIGVRAAIETPVFRADHPFIFLIRDLESGSILFMGRVTEPS